MRGRTLTWALYTFILCFSRMVSRFFFAKDAQWTASSQLRQLLEGVQCGLHVGAFACVKTASHVQVLLAEGGARGWRELATSTAARSAVDTYTARCSPPRLHLC